MTARPIPVVRDERDLLDDTQEPTPGVVRTVLHGLATGITVGILLLTVALAAVTIVVPKVAGATPLTVLSGSMEPNLPVGSLAVVKPVDTNDVRIGDVLTYLPHPEDPTAITHRVTAISNHQDGTRTFTLQGDANNVADDPVQDYQVRGRLWYAIPYLGYVNNWVNGSERHLVVSVAAGGFFVWAGSLWIRAYRDRRHTSPTSRPSPGQGPSSANGTTATPSGRR